MCWIFAYIWEKSASNFLVNGLKDLEYRGYDSAGLVSMNKQWEIYEKKSIWRVVNLEKITEEKQGFNIWIAHTRWATHGKVTQENTHPHKCENSRFFIVLNGIIENFIELKKDLDNDSFYWETDAEVLAKLISFHYKKDLKTTLEKLKNIMRWSFSVAILDKQNPNKIVWIKNWSPLNVWIADWEIFISSDTNALSWIAKEFFSLEDWEIVEITKDSYEVSNWAEKIEKVLEKLDEKTIANDLSGFSYYMEKEIFEIPDVFERSISWLVDIKNKSIESDVLDKIETEIKPERIEIIASGTSYHSWLVAKNMFEKYADIETTAYIANEFKYKKQFINKKTLYIFISQSGETAETRDCQKIVNDLWWHTLALVNAKNSTIERQAKSVLHTKCWIEVAVASTKAFIWNLAVLLWMALYFWKKRNINTKEIENTFVELGNLKDVLTKTLMKKDEIKEISKKYSKFNNIFFLWRTDFLPIAIEWSLKMKEITYIHCEALPSWELKHWPISLIDQNFPCIMINPASSIYEKNVSSAQEIMARWGKVMWIINEGDENSAMYEDFISMPIIGEELSVFPSTVVLFLMSMYSALELWRNVDKPRNLAKSVTVE